MIMKNEEKRLRRCLESVKGLVDEIIIVDTGSSDKSIEIAKSYQARVFIDPWQDDFARPRNIGISYATCPWVIILDPDEVINKTDIPKIKALTLSKKYVAYRMTTKNYTNAAGDPSCIPIKTPDIFSKGFTGYTPSTKTRFFKNGLGVQFKGCYHELLDYYLEAHRLPIKLTNIPIHHWTHEILQKDHKEKMAFYLRMADKKVKEEPDNLHAWWEAGVTYSIAGYRQKALYSMIKSMQSGHTDQKRLFVVARLYKMLGQKDQSRLAFEKGICQIFPNLTHWDPNKKPLDILKYTQG